MATLRIVSRAFCQDLRRFDSIRKREARASRGAGARQPATAPPRCAPTRPTGRIMPPGARRTASSRCRPRRRPSAPTSPAWPKATRPRTIRRRLAAIGKMHRFNDLPWNPAHRDIQGPLQGVAAHPRPPGAEGRRADAAPCCASCSPPATQSARGRRDRALLLFGFAGALRRSELVALQVEDVAIVAGGLRLRIRRGKTDQAGQGAEIGLPRGRHAETCPVRAFEAWQAVAKRKAGPLFRRISTGDGIGDTALHPDAVRRILAHRVGHGRDRAWTGSTG